MSLSERLRQAALERARRSGQKVDDYVLEPTGVIDLREMERETASAVDNSVELPPLDRDPEVEQLYGKPLSETRLWKRVRGTMVPTDGAEAVVDEAPASTAPLPPVEAVTIDLTEDVPLVEIESSADAGLDPALAAQPTLPCQRCGSTAKRDLIDIFNSVEYYSCDDCGHMWQQKKT